VVTTPSESEPPGSLPEFPVESEPTAESASPVVTAPTTVRVSFWILMFSALLRFFFAMVTAVTWNSLVDRAVQTLPAGVTAAQMRSEMHTLLIANIVLDVVFGVLYVLFAYMVRAGRNWARLAVTAVVLVFGLFDILNGTDVFTLFSVLLELVAVGVLYAPTSRAYFATVKAATARRPRL
jgi:hypothetical protein